MEPLRLLEIGNQVDIFERELNGDTAYHVGVFSPQPHGMVNACRGMTG